MPNAECTEKVCGILDISSDEFNNIMNAGHGGKLFSEEI